MKNVALVTGGSIGIGKQLAAIHAEHGGDLVIVARGQKELEACKRELESTYGVEVMINRCNRLMRQPCSSFSRSMCHSSVL